GQLAPAAGAAPLAARRPRREAQPAAAAGAAEAVEPLVHAAPPAHEQVAEDSQAGGDEKLRLCFHGQHSGSEVTARRRRRPRHAPLLPRHPCPSACPRPASRAATSVPRPQPVRQLPGTQRTVLMNSPSAPEATSATSAARTTRTTTDQNVLRDMESFAFQPRRLPPAAQQALLPRLGRPDDAVARLGGGEPL